MSFTNDNTNANIRDCLHDANDQLVAAMDRCRHSPPAAEDDSDVVMMMKDDEPDDDDDDDSDDLAAAFFRKQAQQQQAELELPVDAWAKTILYASTLREGTHVTTSIQAKEAKEDIQRKREAFVERLIKELSKGDGALG